MRVVFDTNIFISAALRGGLAEDVIELAGKGIIFLVTSEEILTELRQKLLSKFDRSPDKVDFFMGKIRQIAEIVEVKEKVSVVKRDPDDNKIGITKHLLPGIIIVRPNKAVDDVFYIRVW